MADNFSNRRRRHNARRKLAEFVANFEPGSADEPEPFVFEPLRAVHAEAVQPRRESNVPVQVLQVRGNMLDRYTVYPDFVDR